MYAFLDTEGSGLFQYEDKETGLPIPADAEGQPRLAQFAVILTDADMNELASIDYLVRPDGWEMSPEATLINGLTTERLIAEGVPVTVVLEAYEKLIADGYAIIAYNAQHDTKTMRAELRRRYRAEHPGEEEVPAGVDLFAQTRNWCAMRACMAAKVKNLGGRGWPKLEHACVHFGIEPEPKPHGAVAGARKCFEVVQALRRIGTEPDPKIHPAKEKPEAA